MYNKTNLFRSRKRFLSPSLSLSYKEPLHIVRGRGQYLYDEKGVQYLDAINNIQHVGHSHPKIIEAANSQLKELNTNTRYIDDTILSYAEALSSKLPDSLNKFFFTNSGSESNDLALRLARNFTNSKETIVLEGAYHGHTSSLIEISPYKHDGPGGKGAPEYVHSAPMPDPFRGKFKGMGSGPKYANEIKNILRGLRKANKQVSAFISEPIMGCAGQLIPPERFLSMTYDAIRSSNGICIADEVQVGFGRLGLSFWGFETQKVVPDIVSMGKSIGNGHPLSVLATNSEIAEKFDNGMEYFNSFGGNPVSCAIGHAVLRIIEEEKLQDNAQEVGKQLHDMLKDVGSNYDFIGDIRGMGLFLGIEIIEDPKTLKPSSIISRNIVEEMKEKRVLLSVDGPDNNVIKIKPPMVFNIRDCQFLIEKLNDVISKY